MKKSLEKHNRNIFEGIPYKKLSFLDTALYDSLALPRVLTESEIISLQDQFLTPGFQYICLTNVQHGRILMQTMLPSLGCYNHIACLTSSKQILPEHITNIYPLLHQSSSEEREQFFITQCYFDFMWIELTHDLLQELWLEEMYHNIMQIGSDKNSTIFIVNYTKNQD